MQGHRCFWLCNAEYRNIDQGSPRYRLITLDDRFTVAQLKGRAVDEWNIPAHLQNLWVQDELSTYRWRDIGSNEDELLANVGVEDGTVVVLTRTMSMEKPVIYLFPPNIKDNDSGSPLEVEVDVRLREGWRFDCIYPPPMHSSNSKRNLPGETRGEEAFVTWKVKAHPDGELEIEEDDMTTSFLFWEAMQAHILFYPCNLVENSQV